MKKLLVTFIVAVGLLVTAQASLFDLGITPGSPASLSAELVRLNRQINLYNTVFDPDLVKPTDQWNITKTEIFDGGTSITLNLLGFNGYMMMKWGDMDRFYHVNDLVQPTIDLFSVSYLGGGYYKFDSDVYNKPGTATLGLSHYTTFSAVSESATPTGAMLCIALGLVHFVRRKMT